MNEREKILSAYWDSVQDVIDWFVGRYFPDSGEPDLNYFVVPSWSYAGCLHIADYYISWEEIEYCLKENISKKLLFAWLEFCEEHNYDTPTNFYNFFTHYPFYPCTKAKTTTKKKPSTTKPSTENRKPKGVKK